MADHKMKSASTEAAPETQEESPKCPHSSGHESPVSFSSHRFSFVGIPTPTGSLVHVPPRPVFSPPVTCIIVHAGAGHHSRRNDAAYLTVCEQACQVAMKNHLKKGATAVSAVRTAIAVLENSGLTNAGTGSNITMNGYVECDATIVDHRGQSGAVGAARGVVRPIELANAVYRNSQKALSLNRAPPNLIVGESGNVLAREHGVKTVSNEQMISAAAKNQWEENREAIAQELRQTADEDSDEEDAHGEKADEEKYASTLSPASTARTTMPFSSRSDAERAFGPPRNPIAFPNVSDTEETPNLTPPSSSSSPSLQPKSPTMFDKDIISDTIGAIAIDRAGNIAAGSSSGGIALRMEGRIGPAALNGIGTHVIPAAPKDMEEKTVATVVSGTGEHLMSSLAASTASQRLYYSAQKTEDGRLEEVDDHDVLKLFVEGDFLEHPAIMSSHTNPAIGVLAVKKSVDGIFLHWAHNADSFALASLSSKELRPQSVISRNRDPKKVTTGGRKIS